MENQQIAMPYLEICVSWTEKYELDDPILEITTAPSHNEALYGPYAAFV